MDRITAMHVFVAVADRASLTEAGEALDMSRAMVSRYSRKLERWLGARVLHSTTRRVSLTHAGEAALHALPPDARGVAGRASAAVADPGTAGQAAHHLQHFVCCGHLAAAVTDFVTQYPGTQVELIATGAHGEPGGGTHRPGSAHRQRSR